MALTVDGNATFGPGPHEVVGGQVARKAKETQMPGLAGTSILTLYEDQEIYVQRGVLRATGASAVAAEQALQALKTAINALVLVGSHALIDDFSRTYSGLVLTSWRVGSKREGPIQAGASYEIIQPYEAQWLRHDFSPAS